MVSPYTMDMDEIDGIDYTLDPMPEPTPDLDGWVLISSTGRARFQCVHVPGLGFAWVTLRRKPDREY